jgi:hypothetical protein
MTKPIKAYFDRKLQDPEYRSEYDSLAAEYESKRKRVQARMGATNQPGAVAFLQKFQADFPGLTDLLDQLAALNRYQLMSGAITQPGALPYVCEIASQSSFHTSYNLQDSTSL